MSAWISNGKRKLFVKIPYSPQNIQVYKIPFFTFCTNNMFLWINSKWIINMNHKNEIMLWNIFEGRKNDKQKCLKLLNIGRSRIQRIEIQLKHSQDVESLRFCFLLHRCNKSNHCLGIDLEHSHRWLRRPWCVVAKIGITVLYAPYGMSHTVWVIQKNLHLGCWQEVEVGWFRKQMVLLSWL